MGKARAGSVDKNTQILTASPLHCRACNRGDCKGNPLLITAAASLWHLTCQCTFALQSDVSVRRVLERVFSLLCHAIHTQPGCLQKQVKKLACYFL